MFKKILESFEQNMLEYENDNYIPKQHEQGGVTAQQLQALEAYLDALYAKNNMDFEFTRHFLDRVNDPRNQKPITFDELKKLFIDSQKRYGSTFAKKKLGYQAVITDLSTKLNSPFMMYIHPKTHHLDLVPKTVMRKDHFHTPDPVYRIESIRSNLRNDTHNMWINDEKAYNQIMAAFSPELDSDGSLIFSGHDYDRACDMLHSLGYDHDVDYGDANVDPLDAPPVEESISSELYNKILRFGITNVFNIMQKKARQENTTLINIVQHGLDNIVAPIVSMIAGKLGDVQWFNKEVFSNDLKDTVQELATSNTEHVNEAILNEVFKRIRTIRTNEFHKKGK